jgi:hypothetical protein
MCFQSFYLDRCNVKERQGGSRTDERDGKGIWERGGKE